MEEPSDKARKLTNHSFYNLLNISNEDFLRCPFVSQNKFPIESC